MTDNTREDLYGALAATLLYPGPDYRAQLDACRQLADATVPAAARRLDTFAAATADLSDVQFEELYTRTSPTMFESFSNSLRSDIIMLPTWSECSASLCSIMNWIAVAPAA